MRHLILCFMLIPILIQAQDNARYLTNAVPVEDGKVVFTKVFPAEGLSKDQLFGVIESWASKRFTDEKNRVVFTDKDKGDFAAAGEQYIVFSSTALSLDRSRMSYRLIMEVRDNTCTMKINGIRYEYDVTYKADPEKYTAEEWITDKNALSKGKLIRITGKFRIATIDFVDETFAQFEQELNKQLPQQQATQKITIAVTDPTPVAADGFVSLPISNIPTTIQEMLPASHLQISLGKANKLNNEGVVWKGFSTMFGKVTASLALPESSPVYQAISADETYTISFLKEATDETPWLRIECRKQGEMNDNTGKIILGEVLRIWIK